MFTLLYYLTFHNLADGPTAYAIIHGSTFNPQGHKEISMVTEEHMCSTNVSEIPACFVYKTQQLIFQSLLLLRF